MPDDEMFRAMEADYAEADALLLGRRIYEVCAASWPQRSSDVANADSNNTPKYVAFDDTSLSRGRRRRSARTGSYPDLLQPDDARRRRYLNPTTIESGPAKASM